VVQVELELKPSKRYRLLGWGSASSPALVAMMKTTNLRDRDNGADIGRLYSARFRTIFLKC
jgi:hypothetical protein